MQHINWSEKNIQEIELFFSTNVNKGLDRESYKNARLQYGANIIKSKFLERQNFYGLEKKKNNLKLIFSRTLSIFGTIYIALLIILNLMNADINIYAIIPFFIFSIILTLVLCSQSEKKHSVLYKRCRPRASVIRSGIKKRVFIENLVPGDVIILSAGDIVPADARIITSNSLSCIEIISHNKTAHINKTDKILNIPSITLSDDITVDSNMVFATDIIASGSGLAVVTATGKNTRIIKSLGNFENNFTAETSDMSGDTYAANGLSRLQKDASAITRRFSLVSVLLAMLLLILGILYDRDLESILLVCFTVVASMFADKLSVITDFAMIQGMSNLASKGTFIKKSCTVDSLNSIDTLIAKKNETYIPNILKVQKIYYDYWDYDVSHQNIMKIGPVLSYMALCSNVGTVRNKKGKIVYTGLPVDVASVKAFRKCGLNFAGLYDIYEKFEKTAYNPQSGSKNVLVYNKSYNKFMLICFGEADNILKRCTRREAAGTNYINLDPKAFDVYKRKIEDLSKSYDSVMAVAVKDYSRDSLNLNNIEADENNLDFIALVSFSESDIFGVYKNIDYLKKSGVTPVMFVNTDNNYTLKSAVRLGIIGKGAQSNNNRILNDEKIARIDDGVFYANADKYRLFMPVSIHNRVKFLKALRFRKKTTAVTVNVLNELAVLNETDISFTPTSTESGVLTNKASVILKNLSVSEISNALKGAVLIYKNIYSIISFAASLFTAQYLLVFFAVVLDGRYLLNVPQMIWGGVITGYMCAVAMCFGEDTHKWYIFRNKIKNYKKYNRAIIKSGVLTGILIFFAAIISFAVCLATEEIKAETDLKIINILMQYVDSDKTVPITSILSAQTGSFVTFVFACLTISLINIKSAHLSDLKILKNSAFIIASALNIGLLAAVMAIPSLGNILGFEVLSIKSILSAVLIGIILPAVYMIIKIKNF